MTAIMAYDARPACALRLRPRYAAAEHYCTVLCGTVTLLCCAVLHCTGRHCIELYCTVLCCDSTVMYCAVLNSAVLSCPVLLFSGARHSPFVGTPFRWGWTRGGPRAALRTLGGASASWPRVRAPARRPEHFRRRWRSLLIAVGSNSPVAGGGPRVCPHSGSEATEAVPGVCGGSLRVLAPVVFVLPNGKGVEGAGAGVA